MIYHFSNCVLDTRQHKFYRAGELIEIEPKVFEVLSYLIKHRGTLISRDELLDSCWPGVYISEGTLTRCITRVRSAIAQNNQRKLIETVHRRGYRFVAEVSEHKEDEEDSSDQPPTAPKNSVSPIPGPLTEPVVIEPEVILAEPVPAHQAAKKADDFLFDVSTLEKFTPFVGRDPELALLNERWIKTQEGNGQAALISGDAGIGKSRLLEHLRHHIISHDFLRLQCSCSPHHQNTAFFPLLELLQRQFPQSAPDPPQQHQQMLQLLLTLLLNEAQQKPLLLIIEDLHWADPATLEFTELLIEQVVVTPILLILTARPEFEPAWERRLMLTPIKLDRLNRSQIVQMLWRITDGKTFPKPALDYILTQTDGVPLFIEELTHALLQSGLLQSSEDDFELSGSLDQLTIPSALQDYLMARLNGLPGGKPIAQYGAVLGREFSHELLAAIVELDTTALQQGLNELLAAELIHQKGLTANTRYIFKHNLMHHIACQSLPGKQRQQLQQRIMDMRKQDSC